MAGTLIRLWGGSKAFSVRRSAFGVRRWGKRVGVSAWGRISVQRSEFSVRGRSRFGRVRLRPNRGFPLDLALDVTPHKSPHIEIDSEANVWRVTSQAGVKREAPTQAELGKTENDHEHPENER
jgi:hypothetical protein